MTEHEIGGSILVAISFAIFFIVCACRYGDHRTSYSDSTKDAKESSKKWLKISAMMMIPACFTWLWVPWLMLICTVIERKNTALVHDLGKPVIVHPAPDITRPSKASEK